MNGDAIPVVMNDLPFRTAYGPKLRVRLDASEETHGTLVKQSFAEEVDVNRIVERFQTTGVLPGAEAPAVFADVSEMPSYHESLTRVRQVEAFFATLDAETREAYGNDPGRWLEAYQEEADADSAAGRGSGDSSDGVRDEGASAPVPPEAVTPS